MRLRMATCSVEAGIAGNNLHLLHLLLVRTHASRVHDYELLLLLLLLLCFLRQLLLQWAALEVGVSSLALVRVRSCNPLSLASFLLYSQMRGIVKLYRKILLLGLAQPQIACCFRFSCRRLRRSVDSAPSTSPATATGASLTTPCPSAPGTEVSAADFRRRLRPFNSSATSSAICFIAIVDSLTALSPPLFLAPECISPSSPAGPLLPGRIRLHRS